MRDLTAVTAVSLNNIATCFIRNHKVTRKLNNILFLYLSAGTSDCNTSSDSYIDIGCTANESVPVLQ